MCPDGSSLSTTLVYCQAPFSDKEPYATDPVILALLSRLFPKRFVRSVVHNEIKRANSVVEFLSVYHELEPDFRRFEGVVVTCP